MLDHLWVLDDNFRHMNLCQCSLDEREEYIDNFDKNIFGYFGVLFDPLILICGLNSDMQIDESEKFKKYRGLKSENQYNGFANVYFSNRIKYIGNIKNGKFDGYGDLYLNNRKYYSGEFKNNLFHGNGELFSNFCDHYIGEFFEGKANGYGVIKWCNGSSYHGNIKNNLLDGYGIYISKTNLKYEGNYEKGYRSGKGKLTSLCDMDEVKFLSEDWIDNTISGKGIIICKNRNFHYEGDIYTFLSLYNLNEMGFMPHGLGKIINYNGQETFVGQFQTGLKHGNGNEYYDNGIKKFAGSFIYNMYEGQGTFYDSLGKIFKGNFHLNRKHGEMTIYHDSDIVEIANFKYDQRFGKSIYTNSNHISEIKYYYNETIVSKKIENLNEEGFNQDDKCSICQCEYKKGDIITKLTKCDHVFHSECLFSWFKKNETCPLCRCEKVFESSKKRKLDEE